MFNVVYCFIIFHMLLTPLFFVFYDFQVATPPRVALPAPALQTPLQAQATFAPVLFTASAPNCRVKDFVRGAASPPVASLSLLWLAHLHLPLSRHPLSGHPLLFSADIQSPFQRQPKLSQPRYIPHQQSYAILCVPKAPSHLAHPS